MQTQERSTGAVALLSGEGGLFFGKLQVSWLDFNAVAEMRDARVRVRREVGRGKLAVDVPSGGVVTGPRSF